MTMPLDSSVPAKLSIQNLGKTFTGRHSRLLVLDGISLDVAPGEFFVVVGASGCGKTTLLRTIQGLEQPSEGRITLDGRPLDGPGMDRGFVFQHDSLFPWRTTMQNVTFGLELQGLSRKDAEARASGIISLVGLSGFEGHYPHELSGGMRQRVNLARAFAIEPDILLMDEPFAALDALTREHMQQELLRIVAEARKTVVFITHQIDEAVLLADRIAVLSARPGRVLAVVDVPFPRPRSLELKRSAEFQKVVDHLWNLIAGAEQASRQELNREETAA